jgi:hypothetical protein
MPSDTHTMCLLLCTRRCNACFQCPNHYTLSCSAVLSSFRLILRRLGLSPRRILQQRRIDRARWQMYVSDYRASDEHVFRRTLHTNVLAIIFKQPSLYTFTLFPNAPSTCPKLFPHAQRSFPMHNMEYHIPISSLPSSTQNNL